MHVFEIFNLFILSQKVAEIFQRVVLEMEKAEGNNVKQDSSCILS